MADAILTLNVGSSSLKLALFGAGENAPRLTSRGEIEDIGSLPHFMVRDATGKVISDQRWSAAGGNFQSVFEKVIGWAEGHLGGNKLMAVGHRIVHGGPDHTRPELVTPELLEVLDRLTPLAPLHEPHNIAPIRAVAAARPDLPQVVCFDTA